jgi:thiol-disulfide isomerase/thioredoxin
MYIYDRRSLRSNDAVLHPSYSLKGLGNSQAAAKQIYAAQPLIRELTDANFWNIFSDRNRVVVVSFWSDACRPCDEVARILSTTAESYNRTIFSNVVNFNQIEWDAKVNPQIHQHIGLKGIPVVYFYYTATGVPPSHTAPLLEGSLGPSDKWNDPEEYEWRIRSILHRHGHALVARIILIDLAKFFTARNSLRNMFTSKLEAKFNGLSPQWLSNQLLSFRVDYRSTEPRLREKQNFGSLDFPMYLLDSSHDETFVRKLMQQHQIPNRIQCPTVRQPADPFELAKACFRESQQRGCGIPPGNGFKKIGFIKTHKISTDPIGKRDLAQAFLNVTSHELGHMLNRCDHSSTGLMKYPVRLDVDMSFSPGDNGFLLGQLLRLRDFR